MSTPGRAKRFAARMLKRHEEFANWSAGVQSLIVAVGVIIAGAWTYFVYQSLQQPQSASMQLLRQQTEIRKIQLDQQKATSDYLRRFGQVALTVTPLAVDQKGLCYLQVNATVTNSSSQELQLVFEDSTKPEEFPLYVAEVRAGRGHKYDYVPRVSTGVQSFTPDGAEVLPLPESSLVPGEASTYPFLVRVPKGRVYLIQFAVPVTEAVQTISLDSFGTLERQERKIRAGATAPPNSSAGPKSPAESWHWTARTYTTACEEPVASPPTGSVRRSPSSSLLPTLREYD